VEVVCRDVNALDIFGNPSVAGSAYDLGFLSKFPTKSVFASSASDD
jgi:hypothetical protein